MKNTFYVSCPIDTFSGYGARARDFVKALIELDEYDVRILPQRWGTTPTGFIESHEEKWGFLSSHITHQIPAQPDIWCQITVPNEFQPMGKFNIGLTAGIETNACAHTWIQGMNKMDVILTSSVHSKNILSHSEFTTQDQKTKKEGPKLILEKPIEVLIEGADLETFKVVKNSELKLTSLKNYINDIPEKFAYLFVGTWIKGDMGHDRKNIGTLVKNFYELFRGVKNKPALILKTSMASPTYMSRREVLRRLDDIKSQIPLSDKSEKEWPSIYLLNGNLNDEEMNELYNHHKIKSMVCLTHGEGFGRPLLEFSLTGKPIITTNWSGHIDFLQPKFTPLVNGELKDLHESAVVDGMLIKGSKWFYPDENHSKFLLTDVLNNYKTYKEKSKKQKHYSKENFSFEVMKHQISDILKRYVPELPKKVELNLSGLGDIKIPKKEKVNG